MKLTCSFLYKRRDLLLRKLNGICRGLGYDLDIEEAMLRVTLCPMGELILGWRRKSVLISSQWEFAGGADTAQAGPGFHKAVADLLDRLSQEGIKQLVVQDDTGYWESRDFERLKKEHFLPWLRKCSGKEAYLCWDMDQYMPEPVPDTVVTPLGRFTRRELRKLDPDRFFLWPNAGKDALYYRNRALYGLWTSCHYTPDDPVNESIIRDLETAFRAEPELPLPVAAYREICILSGQEFQIPEGAPELEEQFQPGYRKGLVRNRIGDLRFTLPGSYRFEVERLGNGSLGSLWQDRSAESPQWRVSGFLRENGRDAEYAADFSQLQDVETLPLKGGKARMGWSGNQITLEAVIGSGLYVITVAFHTPEEREESCRLLRQVERVL